MGGAFERPESMYLLAQERFVIEHILEEELPPDEYYEELGRWLASGRTPTCWST